MKLILASKSPRRKEILQQYGYSFEIISKDVKEDMDFKKTPYENVMEVAYKKGYEVFLENKDCVVLSTDTIVCLDNVIYGKPKDRIDAYNMLKKFSGKTHEVISGVSILSKDIKKRFYVVSKVTFKSLTEKEILDYIDTKEPYDKAGAYAIQGMASKFILKFEGLKSNIIGLPIEEIKPILDELKVR